MVTLLLFVLLIGMICPLCKRELTLIARVSEEGTETKKTTGVCENPNCSLFVNTKAFKGWVVLRKSGKKSG